MNIRLTDFVEVSGLGLSLCPGLLACTGIFPVAGASHELSNLEQGVEEYAGELAKTFPEIPCAF